MRLIIVLGLICSAVVVKMLNVSLATTSPATKSIPGSPSDCAYITCNLTIIIDNINNYNRSGHSILGRPGASARNIPAETRKITSAAGNIFQIYLITELTLTITLKPCASVAEYTATRSEEHH